MAMTALGICNRGSKKPSSNPYAERGLDEFAIVSAELEAKRKRLVAQLGSPCSLVRFESGSDDSIWIPIIICPTLSKPKIEAAHLTTENKPANSGRAHEVRRSSSALISGKSTRSRRLVTGDGKKDDLAHAGDVKICKPGRMSGLIAALQRFLWITAFSLSIVADIVCDLIMPKWHVVTVPERPSQRSDHPKEESFSRNNPSAAMASSTHVSPLTTPASMPRDGIEVITPPHVEAPKTNHRSKTADSRQITKKFLTSVSLPKTFRVQDQASHMGITKDTVPKGPSQGSNHPKEESFSRNSPSAAMASSTDVSPLTTSGSMPGDGIEVISPPHVEAPKTNHRSKTADSRQITKKFLSSVSLPKTFRLQDQASHMGITKDTRLCASVSLPKTNRVQQRSSHKVLRSSTSTVIGKVSNKERKGRHENLGQFLTGAGLVLGLCCLETGYVLAIAGFICWLYALPSLRKVVGGKSFVKNPHQ